MISATSHNDSPKSCFETLNATVYEGGGCGERADAEDFIYATLWDTIRPLDVKSQLSLFSVQSDKSLSLPERRFGSTVEPAGCGRYSTQCFESELSHWSLNVKLTFACVKHRIPAARNATRSHRDRIILISGRIKQFLCSILCNGLWGKCTLGALLCSI